MSDVFEDFDSFGEETSSVFGDVKRQERKTVEVDTRTGEDADVFGSSVKRAEPATVKPKEPPKEESPQDKFAAAMAKSEKREPEERPAKGGRHVITPKQSTIKPEVTTKEAVENVVRETTKKQEERRAAEQEARRQRAREKRGEIPSAKRGEVPSAKRGVKVSEERGELALTEQVREILEPAPKRVERPVQKRVSKEDAARITEEALRKAGRDEVEEREERAIPKRPLKRSVDVGYQIVGKMHTNCGGGSISFLKRYAVGLLNGLKCKSIERKFANAKEFKCKPFRFKILNGEAMITSYSGNARVVEFPAYVIAKGGERIPVSYIHSDCLYSNLLNNYRTKNVVSNLTDVGSSFGLHDDNRIVAVKLPEGLRAIFDDTFYNCIDLTSLTIPSTVEFISNNAFRGSAVAKLFFNGPPVSNWSIDLFSDQHVYVAEEYAEEY